MPNRRRHISVATALLAASMLAAAFAPTTAAASPRAMIVVLRPGASIDATVRAHGAAPTHVFRSSIRGFAAVLGDAQRARLARDARVAYLAADRPVRLVAPRASAKPGGGGSSSQSFPFGVRRIGGLLSATAKLDGIDERVNVDVAVIDTGISSHADLVIADGRNCSTGSSYADGNGHGTHVAGTIGAIDNRTGVAGVAPGARLWSVRVLNNAGSGSISGVICGIDFVTQNADRIEVANMSLSATGSDDGPCGATVDPMHAAICASVAAGVTYVVAAGNEAANASGSVPAAYDEVVTVSALADFDGLAGGTGAATCRADQDDTLADFSNFGADVDIAAPGVCIHSTWKGGGYSTISGTSMASPHVAGAAALIASKAADLAPALVRSMLLDAATDGPIAGDTDGSVEGVPDVSTL